MLKYISKLVGNSKTFLAKGDIFSHLTPNRFTIEFLPIVSFSQKCQKNLTLLGIGLF